MNRRNLLKGAAGVGAVAGVGALGRWALIAPPRSERLDSVNDLAVRIYDALPADVKARACVAYDHPLRQCHNRGLGMGGAHVTAASFDWETRCALTDLMHAGLSEVGRTRLPNQDATRWAGVNLMQLLVCGDPREGPYQIVLSGVHLNLRLGGASPDGAAFGGPQVYGDQRGNEIPGLPGNTYRYQMEAAHELIAALTPAERAAVRVAEAPAQVNIGVQGRDGRFDGVPVGDLAAPKRTRARELVAGILDTYADGDAAYAWDCLERNGGVDALHFADYDRDSGGYSRSAGDSPSQIFRLEGPAAVFHFRGEPHLHAFLNVAMDGERPLSLGEVVGENPQTLEGEDLRAFFETAMRASADADVAYYPSGSVAGRLRAGTVRAGDVWVAESWVDDLAVVEAKGADLSPEIARLLQARGVAPQSASTYRIATTDYVARQEPEQIGRVGARRPLGLLRDALVAHARAHGFAPRA
jgi:hypothetical protein